MDGLGNLRFGKPEPTVGEADPRPEVPGSGVILRIIERAVKSDGLEVEPRLLRAIKTAARASDAELRLAAVHLTDCMKKPDSKVRYLTLLIVHELFTRSKLFRSLLVPGLDGFLALSIGFRCDLPLPPPQSFATSLRQKSIELLVCWNDRFGLHYRQLRLAVDYLKNTLRLHFPNRLEVVARRQREQLERERHTQELLLDKFRHLQLEFDSIKSEIQGTMDELGQCLDIISKNGERMELIDRCDCDGLADPAPSEVNCIRIASLEAGVIARETNENSAVFDVLREAHKLLISKHLASVQCWMSVLIKVDVTADVDNNFRNAALKAFVDIQNCIKSLQKRCEEISLDLSKDRKEPDDGDGDDMWEEGKVESFDPATATASMDDNKGKEILMDSDLKMQESAGNTNLLDSERLKLLAKAPRVSWGPSLYHWDTKAEIQKNQRGLELQSHWGRVDFDDAVIPAEKIAKLSFHCSVYEEEPIDIPPCLAPLKNGGLCQRRDRRVCPFHGPIVPRDEAGNPDGMNTVDGEGDVTLPAPSQVDKMDGDAVNEQLAKQAIRNVRKRDRDQKMSMQKLVIAQVREHNKEVLRDAAIASTSYSSQFGSSSADNGALRKNRKHDSSSMQKKRGSVKDRIVKRLSLR